MPTCPLYLASANNIADGATNTEVPFHLYICVPRAYTWKATLFPDGTCTSLQRGDGKSGARLSSPARAVGMDASATPATLSRSTSPMTCLIFMKRINFLLYLNR